MLRTKVKEYRERAGLKQSELAALVGARRETVVHLEKRPVQPVPQAGHGHCQGVPHHGGGAVLLSEDWAPQAWGHR